MNTIRNRTFAALRSWPLVLAVMAGVAIAHDARVGEIAIEHPFAAPSIAGTTNGAAYFAALENAGSTADRLLGATTPVAARVELHTMAVDAQGVMRMREIDGIALAPHARIEMGPGSGMHLMLIGLKEPLREGRSFPMMLRFERAGKVEVMVVVQGAKPAEGAPAPHKH